MFFFFLYLREVVREGRRGEEASAMVVVELSGFRKLVRVMRGDFEPRDLTSGGVDEIPSVVFSGEGCRRW